MAGDAHQEMGHKVHQKHPGTKGQGVLNPTWSLGLVDHTIRT